MAPAFPSIHSFGLNDTIVNWRCWKLTKQRVHLRCHSQRVLMSDIFRKVCFQVETLWANEAILKDKAS